MGGRIYHDKLVKGVDTSNKGRWLKVDCFRTGIQKIVYLKLLKILLSQNNFCYMPDHVERIPSKHHIMMV